ncbi:MAG: hypothetical protein KGL18_05610 [Burkholderiales bacterium]|nr:hypothetical protein [Burkholderiales bacterium]MDE1927445.1 hypothetical protein [Burkholderiales bacterium]MDE2160724.1 hypothetical protein [Burkholderiales bacterium]MDE2502438.1 hypothetical protein [Burkholderiales bacterium]
MTPHASRLPSRVDTDGGRRWWQFPLVWLVISGPAIVVVAAFATLAIAIIYPDQEVGADTPAATAAHSPGAANAR